jgi:hypothetical protein
MIAMHMKRLLANSKAILKELFLTQEGILMWVIVNVVYATPFAIPFLYGVIINDANYYAISASMYAVMWALPMEIVTPITVYVLLKMIWKKKKMNGLELIRKEATKNLAEQENPEVTVKKPKVFL